MRGDAEDIKLASVPEHPPNDTDELDLGDSTSEAVESGFTMDSRRLAVYGLVVLVIIAALYFVLPKITETGSALEKIQDADPVWIAVALGVNLLSFAAYIALFAGTVGGRTAPPKVRERLDWRASYQITLAGLAATRLFSAGGAGGIALTYWALRRAGMPTRESARRMVAFLVLLYTVYLGALVVCGILLRVGVFPGPSPVSMTIVPAALAGAALVIVFLISLIPGDFERLVASWGPRASPRRPRAARGEHPGDDRERHA